jgi:hypothetical protein
MSRIFAIFLYFLLQAKRYERGTKWGEPPVPARFSHTWIENRFPISQAHDPEVKYMLIEHRPSPQVYFARARKKYAAIFYVQSDVISITAA